MPINTDFKNLLPNSVNYNRLNPLSVPNKEPQNSSAPLENKPMTRREQVVVQKQTVNSSFQIKQTASHQVYNSVVGQTSFARGSMQIGSNNGVDKTTGLTPSQQEQVSTDPKAGPVLPNSVLGVDTSEQAVGAILQKSFKGNAEFENTIGDIANDMAALYRDINNERKAANAPKATGPMTFRSVNVVKTAKSVLTLDQRLEKIDQRLAEACKGTGISGKNFSAMFFLLVMEGIKDAQEFRLDEITTRMLIDKLKLGAKDLAKAKLELNFVMEQETALSKAVNDVANAGNSVFKGAIQNCLSEAEEKAKYDMKQANSADGKALNQMRDKMVSSSKDDVEDGRAQYERDMSDYISTVPEEQRPRLQERVNSQLQEFDKKVNDATIDKEVAKQMALPGNAGLEGDEKKLKEDKIRAQLHEKYDPKPDVGQEEEQEKLEELSPEDKKALWREFSSQLTGDMSTFQVTNDKAGKLENSHLQWLKTELGKDGADTDKIGKAFVAMVGKSAARKMITGDDNLKGNAALVALCGEPRDESQEAFNKALGGDPVDLNNWIKTQKDECHRSDIEIYKEIADEIGQERTNQLITSNISDEKEASKVAGELNEALDKERTGEKTLLGKVIKEGTIPDKSMRKEMLEREESTRKSFGPIGGSLVDTSQKYAEENEILALAKQGYTSKSKFLKLHNEPQNIVDRKIYDANIAHDKLKDAEKAVTPKAIEKQTDENVESLSKCDKNAALEKRKQYGLSEEEVNSIFPDDVFNKDEAHRIMKEHNTQTAQSNLSNCKDKYEAAEKEVRNIKERLDNAITEDLDRRYGKNPTGKKLTQRQAEETSYKNAEKANNIKDKFGYLDNFGKLIGAANEAVAEAKTAGTVGTDVVYAVSSYTQQHRDDVSLAAQQLARMFAAMKLAFR